MKMRVHEYSKLREFIGVYDKGLIDLCIVEGSAGGGKSSIVREVVSDKGQKEEGKHYCWLQGRLTAAAFYEQIYKHQDMPIIVDDVDGLYRDKDSVNLLKCLCQTTPRKEIMWNTLKPRKDSTAPIKFETSSKVCIITNCWKELNKHVTAVEDRGLLLIFKPSVTEVHNYVRNDLSQMPHIFNQEVFDFMEENLAIIKNPSIRYYRNALQLKNAGNTDWKSVLIESFGLSEKEMCVLKLCKDQSLSHNERADLFAKELDMSVQGYWRTKRDLVARGMLQLKWAGDPTGNGRSTAVPAP